VVLIRAGRKKEKHIKERRKSAPHNYRMLLGTGYLRVGLAGSQVLCLADARVEYYRRNNRRIPENNQN